MGRTVIWRQAVKPAVVVIPRTALSWARSVQGGTVPGFRLGERSACDRLLRHMPIYEKNHNAVRPRSPRLAASPTMPSLAVEQESR